jgi:hypothetical protein
MPALFASFLIFLSSSSLAAPTKIDEVDEILTNEVESSETIESIEDLKSIRVSEIKAYLATADASKTCLDEMIQRRNQLILKLSLKPLTAPVGFFGSVFASGISGSYIGGHLPGGNGWASLGGLVVGMAFGGVGAIIYTGVDTSVTAVHLHRLNVILKALGELVLGRSGVKSEQLYVQYQKAAGLNAMPKGTFFERLMTLDQSGALCNGSMVKKPLVGSGSRLKYQVADSKRYIRFLTKSSVMEFHSK